MQATDAGQENAQPTTKGAVEHAFLRFPRNIKSLDVNILNNLTATFTFSHFLFFLFSQSRCPLVYIVYCLGSSCPTPMTCSAEAAAAARLGDDRWAQRLLSQPHPGRMTSGWVIWAVDATRGDIRCARVFSGRGESIFERRRHARYRTPVPIVHYVTWRFASSS